MFKALIFDMDGVIIDSEPLYHKANTNTFNKLKIKVSQDEYNSYVGTNGFYMWSNIKEKHNLKQSVEELIKIENDGFIELLLNMKDPKPITGIKSLINILKKNNIIMAIASSSIKRSIYAVLDTLNIKDMFKKIVSGEDIKNGKPAPDIFLKVAELININPKNCLVIEDSRNGVLAAKSAGMKCIGYQNPNSGNQDLSKSDYITGDLSSLNIKLMKSLFS